VSSLNTAGSREKAQALDDPKLKKLVAAIAEASVFSTTGRRRTLMSPAARRGQCLDGLCAPVVYWRHMDLPIGLTSAIESARCVLFLGAGIGASSRTAGGDKAPTGGELAADLAAQFEISDAEGATLPTVSRVVELRKGRLELEAFLSERLSGLEPDDALQWLIALPWQAIFTTNYDAVIERAFEQNPSPRRNPVVISSSAEVVALDPRFDIPVYHLHGYLYGSGKPRILITEEDYALFYEKRRMLFEILKLNFATSPILYVGYSHNDPNWNMLQAELRAEFAPSEPPHSYRVVPETSPLVKETLRGKGIEALDGDVNTLVAALKASLGDLRPESANLDAIQESVPSDLVPAFEKSPAAVARLLRGWSYVNQAPFHEEPNVRDFLAGNLPNWALVGNDCYFERDIEDSVFEQLLDFATASDPKPRSIIVLGPAGYGVSTILMSLAARLVKESAGVVYKHTTGQALNEGDALFACQAAAPKAAFFVIDNAADEGDRIASLVQRLRDEGIPACLLLGERLNEWRQRHIRLSPQEFGVDPLSDGEIGRLIDLLEAQGALGRLADLDRTLQIAAIREKHEKQLLVAMREATEGRAFDAIVEDEYHGIHGEFARRAYAVVCGLYRFRAYMRDIVLAEVLNCSLVDFYERVGSETDGIVYLDLMDSASETYAARARHQTIAEIVWERAIEAGERQDILLRTLGALNLNFHVDVQAFEALIRSDHTVDGLLSFDGKIRFFEEAARKDPSSPYVLQHYARMLLREDKPELALGQIDAALALDPNPRALRHTRGVILRHLALSLDSIEIARRRLAQSEEEFRTNIAREDRDEYSYQSLAELYLNWGKRAGSEDEAFTYFAKAEEVLTEGIPKVRNREGLFIVSAEVQQTLGDRPGATDALKRAVAAAPGSVVAKYLLGRQLRITGDQEGAIEVLRSVLEGHPNEVRSAIQYALALDALRKPYGEAIAVLRLASLYGFRDPRWIATLGGMLYLNGDFTEADEVFSKADSQTFTFSERTRMLYEPRSRDDPTEPVRLQGRVSGVKPGYAFIQVPGYTDVFCPGSRFGDLVMAPGLEVTFTLGFAARGAQARDPQKC
jgi:tetratricopeptide (TPR) repeat protein